MEKRIVKVADLFIRKEVQVRNIRHEAVDDYAAEMKAGAVFPPPDVFPTASRYYPAKGIHRVLAAKKAELEEMTVRVHEGGHREAILMAVGANAENGIRRTNADKRRAVVALLKDDEWKGWTDGAIAQQCKVSQTFASKVRREMAQNGAEFPAERKGTDGKTRNTTNIGKVASGEGSPQCVAKALSVVPTMEKAVSIGPAPPTEEMQRLRARVSELEREIEEKDRRIEELEQALALTKPRWPLALPWDGMHRHQEAGL